MVTEWRMTEPSCRRSPAVVSMIMARRGAAKDDNRIKKKGIKSQAETIQKKNEGAQRGKSRNKEKTQSVFLT